MRIRKSVAGVAAGTLAVAGIAVAAAPAAQAAVETANVNYQCNTISNGTPFNASTAPVFNVQFDFPNSAVTSSSYTVDVDVTPSPSNGPVGLTNFDADWTIEVVPVVNGTAGSAVVSAPVNATAAVVAANSPTPAIPTLTATLTAPAASGSTVQYRPGVLLANFTADSGFGPQAGTITCTPVAGTAGTTTASTAVNGPAVTVQAVTNLGADNVVGGGDDTVVGSRNGLGVGQGSLVDGDSNPATAEIAVLRDGDLLEFDGNSFWSANNNFYVTVCGAPGPVGAACGPFAYTAPAGTATTPATTTAGTLNDSAYVINTAGFVSGLAYLIVEQHSVACVVTPIAPPGPTNDVSTCSAATRVGFANYPVNLLGSRTVDAPATVSPTVSFAVSGSNWYPGETVTLAPNASVAGDVNGAPVATGVSGAISGTVTLGATSAAASIVGTGVDGSASDAILLSKDQCTRQTGVSGTLFQCDTQQTISTVVNAGALSQAAAQYTGANPDGVVYTKTSIAFPAFNSSTIDQTKSGNLNPITVTDLRGGNSTWSLTASLPGLTGTGDASGASIEANNVAISNISCVDTLGGDSATGITEGGDGDFAPTQSGAGSGIFAGSITLCDASTLAAGSSAGDTTGGQWLVNADLDLTVPAFQKAGDYSGLITITLT